MGAENAEKMQFIVLGAGPVGLATALLLHQQGYSIEIYEKLDEIDPSPEVTYPIGINPRGLETFETISPKLAEKLRSHGDPIEGFSIHKPNGKRIALQETGKGRVLGMTRGFVNHALHEDCIEAGIPIKFGHTLQHVQFDTKLLTFDHKGTTVTIDASDKKLLVCDGVFSKARKSMVEQIPDFKCTLYDWVLRFRVMFVDRDAMPEQFNKHIHYINGGIYTATVPGLKWAIVANVNTKEPEYEPLLTTESSPQKVELLKKFVSERAPQLLPHIPEAEYTEFFGRRSFGGSVVEVNRLNHEEWLVLLGDSAHSVFPATGEGINSGLEDARILAHIMKSDPETAFTKYNADRHPDVHALSIMAQRLERGTWDKAASATELICTISMATGAKLGLVKERKEDYLFGYQKEIKPYREILEIWDRSTSGVRPIASTLVGWFGYDSSIRRWWRNEKAPSTAAAVAGGDEQPVEDGKEKDHHHHIHRPHLHHHKHEEAAA